MPIGLAFYPESGIRSCALERSPLYSPKLGQIQLSPDPSCQGCLLLHPAPSLHLDGSWIQTLETWAPLARFLVQGRSRLDRRQTDHFVDLESGLR